MKTAAFEGPRITDNTERMRLLVSEFSQDIQTIKSTQNPFTRQRDEAKSKRLELVNTRPDEIKVEDAIGFLTRWEGVAMNGEYCHDRLMELATNFAQIGEIMVETTSDLEQQNRRLYQIMQRLLHLLRTEQKLSAELQDEVDRLKYGPSDDEFNDGGDEEWTN